MRRPGQCRRQRRPAGRHGLRRRLVLQCPAAALQRGSKDCIQNQICGLDLLFKVLFIFGYESKKLLCKIHLLVLFGVYLYLINLD